MSAVTLEAAQAQLDEAQASVDKAKAIIEQVKAHSLIKVLKIAGIEITLQPGERYAGAVLDADGNVKHHVILLAARPKDDLNWDGAMAWAQEAGGTLPDRQEQALLSANCKPHLKPVWHWSCQQHEESVSYAWNCLFFNGDQYYYHKSYEGAAVAVRRFTA